MVVEALHLSSWRLQRRSRSLCFSQVWPKFWWSNYLMSLVYSSKSVVTPYFFRHWSWSYFYAVCIDCVVSIWTHGSYRIYFDDEVSPTFWGLLEGLLVIVKKVRSGITQKSAAGKRRFQAFARVDELVGLLREGPAVQGMEVILIPWTNIFFLITWGWEDSFTFFLSMCDMSLLWRVPSLPTQMWFSGKITHCNFNSPIQGGHSWNCFKSCRDNQQLLFLSINPQQLQTCGSLHHLHPTRMKFNPNIKSSTWKKRQWYSLRSWWKQYVAIFSLCICISNQSGWNFLSTTWMDMQ